MAEGRLVDRRAPRLRVNNEEDGEDAMEFFQTSLAYLETRANHTEDTRINGIQLSDVLHRAAMELRSEEGQQLARQVGHSLAAKAQDTDAATAQVEDEMREITKRILGSYVEGAYEHGGRLLDEYLRKMMCNRSGAEIFTYEVLATLFKFFWVQFKDAIVDSTTDIAFIILEMVLKKTVNFLQNIGFFQISGGWKEYMLKLIKEHKTIVGISVAAAIGVAAIGLIGAGIYFSSNSNSKKK